MANSSSPRTISSSEKDALIFQLTDVFLLAVILLNVRSFYDPLRQLIKDGVREGFIDPVNEHIVVFIDGPPSIEEHGSFDWGKAALEAIDSWHIEALKPMFDWTKRHEERDDDKLKAT